MHRKKQVQQYHGWGGAAHTSPVPHAVHSFLATAKSCSTIIISSLNTNMRVKFSRGCKPQLRAPGSSLADAYTFLVAKIKVHCLCEGGGGGVFLSRTRITPFLISLNVSHTYSEFMYSIVSYTFLGHGQRGYDRLRLFQPNGLGRESRTVGGARTCPSRPQVQICRAGNAHSQCK